MFRAIKDTNTGVVYDWVNTLEDGTEIWVSIPPENWKRENEWTSEEIELLFSTAQENTKSDDDPTFL